MSDVQRWSSHVTPLGCPDMIYRPDGDYVLHSDYEKMEARLMWMIETRAFFNGIEKLVWFHDDCRESMYVLEAGKMATIDAAMGVRND